VAAFLAAFALAILPATQQALTATPAQWAAFAYLGVVSMFLPGAPAPLSAQGL